MIYYIHGFGSSCSSRKAIAFDFAKCIEYSINDLNNGKIFEIINKINKEDIVIGSSLGGFLALTTDAYVKILLNPAISVDGLMNYGDFSNFINICKIKSLKFTNVFAFISRNDEIIKHDINYLMNKCKEIYIIDGDHRFTKRFNIVLSSIKSIILYELNNSENNC